MGERSVRLEAQRMERVPEPAIDKLQESELSRGENAAPQTRGVEGHRLRNLPIRIWRVHHRCLSKSCRMHASTPSLAEQALASR
jgi:hypothetical protein